MDKNAENEMENGLTWWVVGLSVSGNHRCRFGVPKLTKDYSILGSTSATSGPLWQLSSQMKLSPDMKRSQEAHVSYSLNS